MLRNGVVRCDPIRYYTICYDVIWYGDGQRRLITGGKVIVITKCNGSHITSFLVILCDKMVYLFRLLGSCLKFQLSFNVAANIDSLEK